MSIVDERNRKTGENIEDNYYEQGKFEFEDALKTTSTVIEIYSACQEKAEKHFKKFNDAFEERDENGNKIDFDTRKLKMDEALYDLDRLFIKFPGMVAYPPMPEDSN